MRVVERLLSSLPGAGVTHTLERSQTVRGSQAEVFAFFAEARNLEAITPPWLRFEIVADGPIAMRRGAVIDYRLRLRGVPLVWRSRIAVWEPPHRFVDEQVLGPYALWEHTHRLRQADGGRTRIEDEVRYALPLWRLGDLAHAVLVRSDIERIFDYRRYAVAEHLANEGGGHPPSIGRTG